VEKELCVLRTKTQFSKYLMIGHQISTQNENRWDLLMSSTRRIDKDGLININNVSKILKIEQHYKYTRILVDVNL
jgi:hypothetical protein